MINKKPKGVPLIQKVFGVAIIGEVLLFGAAYFTWERLNIDRNFRKTAQTKYPWILEKYYRVGEILNSKNTIREQDQLVWDAEDRFKDPGTGAFGLFLLQFCQPRPAEIDKLKTYGNPTLAVVKSAASSPEPLYRQSSAQIQQIAHAAVKQMEVEIAATKRK